MENSANRKRWLPSPAQSRTQSNACAQARMALALWKLTTGTPKFRGSGFVGMHVKPITAQEKFNFPRANAILACAQALLWVRDCRRLASKARLFTFTSCLNRLFSPVTLFFLLYFQGVITSNSCPRLSFEQNSACNRQCSYKLQKIDPFPTMTLIANT
jgi:hypothetical protein